MLTPLLAASYGHYGRPPCAAYEHIGMADCDGSGACGREFCAPTCDASGGCPLLNSSLPGAEPLCKLESDTPPPARSYCALFCGADNDCPAQQTCSVLAGAGGWPILAVCAFNATGPPTFSGTMLRVAAAVSNDSSVSDPPAAPPGMTPAPPLFAPPSPPSPTCGASAGCGPCETCQVAYDTCVAEPCVPFSRGTCGCPMLSSATLAAVGAVLLCLLLLLLLMAIWPRGDGCCADCVGRETTTPIAMADAHEGLLDSRDTSGMVRETVDSSISCAVCFETPINSILMPCAHEVACMRCAQRLGVCPICRAPVCTTLRTLPAPFQASGSSLGKDEDPPPSPARHMQQCLNCQAQYANCVFLPCSHKVWCADCAAELPDNCPVCDSAITQSLRTFHKRL